jgi:hypothetical protein
LVAQRTLTKILLVAALTLLAGLAGCRRGARRKPGAPSVPSTTQRAPPTAIRESPEDGRLLFQTTKVSTRAELTIQGETSLAVDDAGHVVVAWAHCPVPAALMRAHVATSSDHGATFSPDVMVDGNARLVDPSIDLDNGTLRLGLLRNHTLTGWTDVSVLLYESSDFGKTWSAPATLDGGRIFNDRDWIRSSRDGTLHVVVSPRLKVGGRNWDRPVYYRSRTRGHVSDRVLVNPPGHRSSGMAGGFVTGLEVADDGRILVPVREIPLDDDNGYGASKPSPGSLYVSADAGRTFEGPMVFTPPDKFIVGTSFEEHGVIKSHPRISTHERDVFVTWIGQAGAEHAVYVTRLPAGKTRFEPPVAAVRAPADTLTIATVVTDRKGRLHLFWLAKHPDGIFRPMYSRSDDRGATFRAAVAITAFGFEGDKWPGDFNEAAVSGHDVFHSWAAPSGPNAGVYVSILRGGVE